MNIIVVKNYEEVSRTASEIISKEIVKKPDIVLGLATGSTPIGTYRELIKMHNEDGLDFSEVTSFNLDEYIGLDENNTNSYRYFMDNELFNHINIKKENTHVPNGRAENIESYCSFYEKIIDEAGGIDIQILGIGPNGHIAFNEPDESLSVGTCVVKLTEDTINANARFFDSIEDVPKTAISMGIGSILKAKKIILLASGKAKAKAIKMLLEENKISTRMPASLLLLHSDVTLILDEDAYSEVK